MRIALIYPATEFDQRYHKYSLPMGLLSLAAVVETLGMGEVDVFDARHREARPEASDLNEYDLIGFSAMSMQISHALQMAQALRADGYRGPIAFGGPHASVAPEHLKAQECVDAVFVGESERSFPEYLKHLAGEPHAMQRLWLRGSGGEWAWFEGDAFVEDLDSLPLPARHKLPRAVRESQAINITTTRGCPFQCNYCQPSKQILFGKKIRRRTTESVVSEIRDAVERYGIRQFSIDDDTFTFHEPSVREFCEKVAPLGLTWSCQTRTDIAAETLRLMRDSGCDSVFVGVESGSQRMLDLMNKHNTVEKNEAFIKVCREVGVRTWCNMMLGYPGETPRDMHLSVRFLQRAMPDRVCVSQVTPFPGTRLWSEHRDDIIANDWDDVARHVMKPKFRSMARLQKRIILYVGLMSKEYDAPMAGLCVPTEGLLGELAMRFPLMLRLMSRRWRRMLPLYEAGLAAAREGDVERGVALLDEARRKFPRYKDLYGHAAWLKMGLERFDAAARDYERLIRLDPGDAEAHRLLARARMALGRPDAARKAMRRAIEMDPGYAECEEARRLAGEDDSSR